MNDALIRTGFVFSTTDNSWIGGLNYMTNLIRAIMALPDRRIAPVFFVPPDMPQERLAAFGPIEVVRTPWVRESGACALLRKILTRVTGVDWPMQLLLRRHNIDVLSHAAPLGPRASLPVICWIADFQHVRMPEFFSAAEIAARDRGYGRYASEAAVVLLSSEDARRDLAAFAPAALARSRVLNFVVGISAEPTLTLAQLQQKYGFDEPYFHLPNQFWAHKNHRIVVEALALMAKEGRAPLVLATGHTRDHRQPNHFAELEKLIAARGLGDRFRILGLVPYADLPALMVHSVALINPSFFEGWSTTVEEAKSLGQPIVLSDIPVHREQNPPGGFFFDPTDAESLVAALDEARLVGAGARATLRAQAAQALAHRLRDFGLLYQTIVAEAMPDGAPGAKRD